MSECNHNCNSCGQSCGERKENPFAVPMNEYSDIRKVIGVVSGKGGVGKSLVTSLLAASMNKKGHQVAILDADITGPSIPRAFGLKEKALVSEECIYPAVTENGIEVMSLNLINSEETAPVVWRGPVIAGAVKQFWSDVRWGDVDYMFVDMPPGTGDVPLTVFQSLPLAGIVVVTSPQDLVSMIVSKAINMANMMDIPVLGIVENYSYLECPDCGKKISVFGESKVEAMAQEFAIDTYAKIPISTEIAKLVDSGCAPSVNADFLDALVSKIEGLEE